MVAVVVEPLVDDIALVHRVRLDEERNFFSKIHQAFCLECEWELEVLDKEQARRAAVRHVLNPEGY